MSETIVAAGFDLEAALASLPACVRCRNRRIKCDTSLPACTNCEKAAEVCTYRDHVLATNVSRPDLATLVARYRELSAMKQGSVDIPQDLLPVNRPEDSSNVDSTPSLHISGPRLQNGASFWGPSSIYSKLAAAMITLGRLPPPELMLQRTQCRILDFFPGPDLDGAILPELTICRRLLRIYHTSIESFYPIFGWDRLTLLLERAYSPSSVQGEPVLFLLLAVAVQALSRVDHRLVEQAKAYYRSFEKLASAQLKSSPSIEWLRYLLLRSVYMLMNQSLNQSWHLLGMAQGLLSDLVLELKTENSTYLLITSASLENQVGVEFGRPIVLTESLTLDTLQDADLSEHSPLAFLVYKLSNIQYAIFSFVETVTLSWETFELQTRGNLGHWITDWNIAIADISKAQSYATWLRTSGSVMYDQCLLELLWQASHGSDYRGEATGVARRLIENFQRLHTFANMSIGPMLGVEVDNGFDGSIFPFFWTHTHAICNACLLLLQSQRGDNSALYEDGDNIIEKGLSLILTLDSSQTLFRIIWSLQNSKTSKID